MKKAMFAFLLFFCIVLPVHAATELIVYSDMEPDLLNRYNKELAEKMPDIAIKWVRESGGPITARIIAEKDNPQADIIFGLALTSVLTIDNLGLLEPYTPAGAQEISPLMRDMREDPTWVGMNVVASAICCNTIEMKKAKLPSPSRWEDLIEPAYQGSIVMPNPVSSGTGYQLIAGWFAVMGEEKAWKYMEDLHKNVKMYTHSGSKPAQMTGTGETAIGLSTSTYAAPYIKKRAPIQPIQPNNGVGWDVVASAIVKGTRNLEAAQRLMDYAASRDASLIGMEFDYIPVRPELDNETLKAIRPLLLPIDFYQAASMRERVLNEWRRRFEGN